jgi:hypothetical protein
LAPEAVNVDANASPMPELPPVTTAVLSVKSIVMPGSPVL